MKVEEFKEHEEGGKVGYRNNLYRTMFIHFCTVVARRPLNEIGNFWKYYFIEKLGEELMRNPTLCRDILFTFTN